MSETRSKQYPFSAAVAMKHFTDPDWMAKKFAALGHEDINVHPAKTEGKTVITSSERSVPLEVPSFAKKFINPMSKVAEKDVYTESNGGYEGTWRIDVKGAPVLASGIITLTPSADGKGCTHLISAQVDVSVPLIGKKIAASLIADTLKGIEDDLAYNAANISA